MRLAFRQTHLYRLVNMEVTPGFEPGNEGFADPCLTTWLCHRVSENHYTICRRPLSRVKCAPKRDFFRCFLCYFMAAFIVTTVIKNVKINRTNVAMYEKACYNGCGRTADTVRGRRRGARAEAVIALFGASQFDPASGGYLRGLERAQGQKRKLEVQKQRTRRTYKNGPAPARGA